MQPLWSLYSPHGPVFRTLVRLAPAGSAVQLQEQRQRWAFLMHDPRTGENAVVGWEQLGSACNSSSSCGSSSKGASSEAGTSSGSKTASDGGHGAANRGEGGARGGARRRHKPSHLEQQPVVSGPLWTGPLHSPEHLGRLEAAAADRGWLPADPTLVLPLPSRAGGGARSLGQLLDLLRAEADARLPPWYIRCDDVGRWGRLAGPPARDALVAALRRRSWAAAPTHIHPGALRTDASMAQVLEVCWQDLGIAQRQL